MARNTVIKESDLPEFIGQVIDIFEDFLEAKGVEIPNDDRAGDPDAAIIYGEDYGELQGSIQQLLENWDICASVKAEGARKCQHGPASRRT